jgi:hypothetical protein
VLGGGSLRSSSLHNFQAYHASLNQELTDAVDTKLLPASTSNCSPHYQRSRNRRSSSGRSNVGEGRACGDAVARFLRVAGLQTADGTVANISKPWRALHRSAIASHLDALVLFDCCRYGSNRTSA